MEMEERFRGRAAINTLGTDLVESRFEADFGLGLARRDIT